MDFTESPEVIEFKKYVDSVYDEKLKHLLAGWRKENTTPRELFRILGEAELNGFRVKGEDVEPIPWQQLAWRYAGEQTALPCI